MEKQALSKDKDLQKHSFTQRHFIWMEREEHENMNLSVSSLVCNDAFEKKLYYVNRLLKSYNFWF